MKARTCLRFPGGKFYGVKQIKPFLNVKHDEYREPFIGGASVFLSKELAPKVNWINDSDKELINFYKTIQSDDSRVKLYDLLEGEVASRERHAEVKAMKPKNNVERAFRFFYLNRTSFSGIMVKPRWGYALGSSVTPDRWTKIIEPVAKKLQNITITCLDFREVIQAKSESDDVLMYIDPPYFAASKDIYNNQLTKQDHIDLCEILKKCPHKFILSYDNSDEIKKMYKWTNVNELNWTYFMSEERRQVGQELLIANFDIDLKIFS